MGISRRFFLATIALGSIAAAANHTSTTRVKRPNPYDGSLLTPQELRNQPGKRPEGGVHKTQPR